MPVSRSRRLLVGSLASALAVPSLVAAQGMAKKAEAEKVKCYGINKCKGVGDCGGPGHSCAGQNACKGHGYIELDKETCLRIEGGRLTAEKPAESQNKPAKKGE